ncbi:MAG TPA: hypothetical protein PL152_07180 [Steroidobacteraceae bacterium]|nr:hypothetical protein [Steroidobacteraceae bacterium]
MHARIDQLLSIRDGEPVDAAVQRHVESCHTCGSEIARLAAVRDGLGVLAAAEARPGEWMAVQARITRRARAIRQGALAWRAVAAATFIALVLSLVASFDREPDGGVTLATNTAAPMHTSSGDVASLVERSRQLEQVLASMPSRPAVERADTSMPIDALEARVRWLDHQLSQGDGLALPGGGAERLWRERVDIMNSLVRLRYVEAQRVAL